MNRSHAYVSLATGLALVLAVFEMPFEYYELLRGLVTVSAVLVAAHSIVTKQYAWLLAAIPSFMLWFPLFAVELDRSIWGRLDAIFAVCYISFGLLYRKDATVNAE